MLLTLLLPVSWLVAPACACFGQASFRGHATRQNVLKMKAGKAEAEKKLADVKARRVWLKKHSGAGEPDTVGMLWVHSRGCCADVRPGWLGVSAESQSFNSPRRD